MPERKRYGGYRENQRHHDDRDKRSSYRSRHRSSYDEHRRPKKETDPPPPPATRRDKGLIEEVSGWVAKTTTVASGLREVSNARNKKKHDPLAAGLEVAGRILEIVHRKAKKINEEEFKKHEQRDRSRSRSRVRSKSIPAGRTDYASQSNEWRNRNRGYTKTNSNKEDNRGRMKDRIESRHRGKSHSTTTHPRRSYPPGYHSATYYPPETPRQPAYTATKEQRWPPPTEQPYYYNPQTQRTYGRNYNPESTTYPRRNYPGYHSTTYHPTETSRQPAYTATKEQRWPPPTEQPYYYNPQTQRTYGRNYNPQSTEPPYQNYPSYHSATYYPTETPRQPAYTATREQQQWTEEDASYTYNNYPTYRRQQRSRSQHTDYRGVAEEASSSSLPENQPAKVSSSQTIHQQPERNNPKKNSYDLQRFYPINNSLNSDQYYEHSKRHRSKSRNQD